MTLDQSLKTIFLCNNPAINIEGLIKQINFFNDLPLFNKEQVLQEAKVLPKPLTQAPIRTQAKQRIETQTWNRIACLVLSCFTWPFNFFVLPNPFKSFYDVINLTSIYQLGLVNPVKHLLTYAPKYYIGDSYYRIAALVAFLAGLCVLAKCIDTWTGITRSVDLQKLSYRNLNAEVQDNKIHLLTTQRTEQINKLALCLSDSDLQAPTEMFPIFVGPPGVGKTASVSNLVYQVQRLNKHPELKGKTFYAINAAEWASGKKIDQAAYDSSSDSLSSQIVSIEELRHFLFIIKGAEKDTILFIDEAHCLSNQCIELLNTYLIELQLKVIFATTEKQYEKFKKHPGFVDRLMKIAFPTLKDDEARTILQEIFSYEKTHIRIEEKAFDAVIQIGHKLYPERSNPRMSIQLMKLVLKMAKQWAPTTKLYKKQAQEQQTSLATRQLMYKIFDSQDISEQDCQTLRIEHPILEEDIQRIDDLFQQLRKLQTRQWDLQQGLCKVVHQIKEDPIFALSDDAQKLYLLYKQALKVLQNVIQETSEKFEKESEETFPFRITAKFVHNVLTSSKNGR